MLAEALRRVYSATRVDKKRGPIVEGKEEKR
jgi:hypothetical protein